MCTEKTGTHRISGIEHLNGSEVQPTVTAAEEQQKNQQTVVVFTTSTG